jgi:hypothetical protein
MYAMADSMFPTTSYSPREFYKLNGTAENEVQDTSCRGSGGVPQL